MKVVLINGSPHRKGNTFIALSEVAGALEKEGVQTEIIQLGIKAVQGCIACNKCAELGHCVFQDTLYNQVREALQEADGIVVGSPVYYAGPNGALCALLDRVFYSCSELLAYKAGASVAVCRRGGASATFDRLNKYFTILNMPVVSSQYWNSVHGMRPGEATEDAEGLQTMRMLGRNMAWLLKGVKRDENFKSSGNLKDEHLSPCFLKYPDFYIGVFSCLYGYFSLLLRILIYKIG